VEFVLPLSRPAPAPGVSTEPLIAYAGVLRWVWQIVNWKVRAEIRDTTRPAGKPAQAGFQTILEEIFKHREQLEKEGFIFDANGWPVGFMGPQWRADP